MAWGASSQLFHLRGGVELILCSRDLTRYSSYFIFMLFSVASVSLSYIYRSCLSTSLYLSYTFPSPPWRAVRSICVCLFWGATELLK